ncbi:carboxy-terminal processing protease CtpA [soil metagenome]
MRGKQTRQQTAANMQRFTQNRTARTVSFCLLLVIVFGVGLSIGNGRLSLPSHGVVSKDLPATLNYSSVNQLYQSIKENYNGKLTETQLIDGLKHGLAEATNDPYTVYFTAKEADSFDSDLNNTFSGVGAELGKNAQGNIQVIAPIAGTPAEKAGLKAQDLIATINDKTTAGMSVDDAVKAIRGKAGTTVKLQLVRGGTQAVELTITRETIQVPSVTDKTLDNNIGYIRISTFANDTPRLIHETAEKLKKADVKGIVLDLRNNPGGAVDSAVAVSSEWLPQGANIMQEKRGAEVIQSYQSTGTSTLKDIPTVVLINPGSASASEIVAAALRDNKQAYIIGEKSYGKGVVQQLVNFRDGSQLKVTIASWYRPNGKNINHLGITPDSEAKLSDADATAGNDTQLKAAQDYLNK